MECMCSLLIRMIGCFCVFWRSCVIMWIGMVWMLWLVRRLGLVGSCLFVFFVVIFCMWCLDRICFWRC